METPDGNMSSEGEAKLFVGGVPRAATDDSFRGCLQAFGPVKDIILMRDHYTHQPRGFGFVTYISRESAQRCIDAKPMLEGRTLDVKWAIPQDSKELPPPKQRQHAPAPAQPVPTGTISKVFVGGLSHESTTQDLLTHFNTFGEVTDHVVMYDKINNRSRGFGFVTFADPAIAQQVSDNNDHIINGKRVDVKLATPKESTPRGGMRADPGRGYGYSGGAGGGGYGQGPPYDYGRGPNMYSAPISREPQYLRHHMPNRGAWRAQSNFSSGPPGSMSYPPPSTHQHASYGAPAYDNRGPGAVPGQSQGVPQQYQGYGAMSASHMDQSRNVGYNYQPQPQHMQMQSQGYAQPVYQQAVYSQDPYAYQAQPGSERVQQRY